MSAEAPCRFLSCDWGTTAFRLRWVERHAAGQSAGGDQASIGFNWRVVRELRTDDGAKAIYTRHTEQGTGGSIADAFARVLGNAIRQLDAPEDPIPEDALVVISGMASSTVGWKELPYAEVPCGVGGEGLRVERIAAPEILGSVRPVWMVSGLRTGGDIMRGEETELVGILSLPELASIQDGCLVLLPGTHSKHVRVEGGRIVDFRTHMTGELLEMLSTRSLLRVSVVWPPPPPEVDRADLWDALRDGVLRVKEAGLSRALFQVRARSVLDRVPNGLNAWFLSGLVMGSEVLDLLRWDAHLPVVLAGGMHFMSRYQKVFEVLDAAKRLRLVPAESLLDSTVRAHAMLLAGQLGGDWESNRKRWT